MPGALILEAMAQVGCVAFLAQPENQGRIVLFGGVKDARFRRKVTPGDVLEMECTLTAFRSGIGFWQGQGCRGWRGCGHSRADFLPWKRAKAGCIPENWL